MIYLCLNSFCSKFMVELELDVGWKDDPPVCSECGDELHREEELC